MTKSTKISRRSFLKAVGAVTGYLAAHPYLKGSAKALAQDVPSVAPISILINDSPWFPGFAAMVLDVFLVSLAAVGILSILDHPNVSNPFV